MMQLMTVDQDLCRKDGACVLVCPVGRLQQNGEGFPEIAPGKEAACIRCGHCVAVCPHGAISLRKVSLEACMALPDEARQFDFADLEQLVKTRRSIRKYSDKPVARETLERLLEMTRWCPTACNGQPVRWTIVDGREKVQQMAAMVVDWARGKQITPDIVSLWEKGEDWALRDAPHVAIASGPAGFGPADYVIAAATLELMASALGVGACWAGFFSGAANSWQPLREFLGVAEGHSVHAALMLGYPEYQYHRIPPRRASGITWI